MFNINKNEMKISLGIIPKSPLLIKASNDVQEKGNLIQWNITAGSKGPFISGSTLKGMLKGVFYTIWYDYFNLEEDKFKDIPEGKYKNDDKVYDYEDYMEEILKEKGEDIFLEKSLKISKLFGATFLNDKIYKIFSSEICKNILLSRGIFIEDINTLLNFAFYCDIRTKSSVGFGQVLIKNLEGVER